ncbi:hypothetical protein IG626_09445 [Desulfovibrio desulfuricans]|uniref:hypothetical protein n=1 Tax=Desulfovibrio desulfuricans TaxID=876 RepID=UPI0017877AE8|nr:hypothetical protein [Desulfovibrio desulfuricans]MBD8896225.1 hypothetical protein [Desulfovibrio desulfuricans]
MADYQEFKTPSGVVVQVRQRTYPEWEENELNRMACADKISSAEKGGDHTALLEGQRLYHNLRGARLTLWVKDWEKVKKGGISLGDVNAIEKHCLALENGEISEKN